MKGFGSNSEFSQTIRDVAVGQILVARVVPFPYPLNFPRRIQDAGDFWDTLLRFSSGFFQVSNLYRSTTCCLFYAASSVNQNLFFSEILAFRVGRLICRGAQLVVVYVWTETGDVLIWPNVRYCDTFELKVTFWSMMIGVSSTTHNVTPTLRFFLAYVPMP